MNKPFKSIKRITCILGILFISLGIIPIPALSQVSAASAEMLLSPGFLSDSLSAVAMCTYSPWGECSVECGGGTQSRTLESGPADQCTDLTQSCNTHSCCQPAGCPGACGFTGDPAYPDGCGGTLDCPATEECCEPASCPSECGFAGDPAYPDNCGEFLDCPATGACPSDPDDCVGEWSACVGECSSFGTQAFTIISPAAQGGKDCEFDDGDKRLCETAPCAFDCEGEWSGCSGRCGTTGLQTFIITQQALNGGEDCEYADGETRECQNRDCPLPAPPQAYSSGNTAAAGAGGAAEELVIIPVTGVDLDRHFGFQELSLCLGLTLFGVTLILEGLTVKHKG